MRLFKHGDSLAVVIPGDLRKKFNFKENQDFEFFELDDAVLVMFNRDTLAKQVKNRTLVELLQKLGAGTVGTANAPVAMPVQPLTIFASETEAKIAAKKFETQIKSGELIAVPGTDKKIYFLSAQFYAATSSKLVQLLEKEKTLAELCTASGLEQKEVFATLQAMKDKSEVIEKKKGCYLAVK